MRANWERYLVYGVIALFGVLGLLAQLFRSDASDGDTGDEGLAIPCLGFAMLLFFWLAVWATRRKRHKRPPDGDTSKMR